MSSLFNIPFRNKVKREATESPKSANEEELSDGGTLKANPVSRQPTVLQRPPKLVFHCQLAHGSPTGLISDFASITELYERIASCYDIPLEEILFCTLNTHKLDMSQLLGGQIALNDFIFVHLKGQKKEVDILKENSALGLTITDNGHGVAFIKRLKPGSTAERLTNAVKIGDHIEKLNGVSMVGKRHFDVAKALRDIPAGSTFTLRLIEPLQAGFANIGPRSTAAKKGGYGSGKQTLRFKAKGGATVEEAPNDLLIDGINGALESYLELSDRDLAMSIWELGRTCQNPVEFAREIGQSDLAAFQMPDELLFDMWGVINDFKKGRLKERQ